MENNDKVGETIEHSWHISPDEPVRSIKWCSLKVLEETTRKMHVFIGGVFERINPLEYRGKNHGIEIETTFWNSFDISAKISPTKVISLYEKNESLIINLPKIKDFSMIIVKPMIGSATGDNIISEFKTETMQMAIPFSSDKMELKYQFDILYLKN